MQAADVLKAYVYSRIPNVLPQMSNATYLHRRTLRNVPGKQMNKARRMNEQQ